MYTVPSFIHIYGIENITNPDLGKVSVYLNSLLPESAVDTRIDLVSYYIKHLNITKLDDEADSLARRLAAIRVINPDKEKLNPEPLYAEIDYERRKILNPATHSLGVFYDGFELQNIFYSIIRKSRGVTTPLPVGQPIHRMGAPRSNRSSAPPLEGGERGGYKDECSFAHIHIAFINQLIATWEDDDNRYHARASVYGFPSIISTAGIVEAPAKPREFYLLRQQYGATGRDDLALVEIKKKFKDSFIDYNDPRMTEVCKGYVAQALFFHIAGEPFCEDKGCRLFNAHWQKELIYSQLETPYEFCEKHAGILEIVRGKS